MAQVIETLHAGKVWDFTVSVPSVNAKI